MTTKKIRTFFKPRLNTKAEEVWELCKMRKKKVKIIRFDFVKLNLLVLIIHSGYCRFTKNFAYVL